MPDHIKQTLVSIYQQYPREIQQAFCEIKKVFIATGDSTVAAIAEYYYDPATVKIRPGGKHPRFSGTPTGFILQINEKHRFNNETAAASLTRVFQARCGAFSDQSSLPVADYQTPFAETGALATTIVHELGHMLARAHKVTSTYFLPASEGPWSKLSFRLVGGDFQLRHAEPGYGESLRFKLLSNEDVELTIELFKKTGIATLYGGYSPQEDFAEFFRLTYYDNLKWQVKGEVILDLAKEIASNPAFLAKKEIIRKLMALPEPFSLKNRGVVSGEIGPM